jgi:hypothetical protein
MDQTQEGVAVESGTGLSKPPEGAKPAPYFVLENEQLSAGSGTPLQGCS